MFTAEEEIILREIALKKMKEEAIKVIVEDARTSISLLQSQIDSVNSKLQSDCTIVNSAKTAEELKP